MAQIDFVHDPAQHSERVKIPIIDLGLYESPDETSRLEQVANIRRACREYGFFHLRNHGVPLEMQDEIVAMTKQLFNLPQQIKDDMSLALSQRSRGYSPIGNQQLDPEGLPDLKESYYITKDFPGSGNMYPPSENLPAFRKTADKYYDAMIQLSQRLFRLLAASLPVDPDYFDGYSGVNRSAKSWTGSTLRLVHYPQRSQEVSERQMACGSHTDFGSITLLLQDAISGLEIKPPKQSDWVAVPPIRDVYVVNIGDLMQKWTNGEYVSAVHRVSHDQNVDRYSVPFFFNGNYDYVIKPLENGRQVGSKSEANYESFTVGGHILSRLQQTHVEGLAH
ncbi:oxidoreductase [Xylariaceae sp. FL0255]|nr:oxidoreductase [Xylariaceae sp. FL0255]